MGSGLIGSEDRMRYRKYKVKMIGDERNVGGYVRGDTS